MLLSHQNLQDQVDRYVGNCFEGETPPQAAELAWILGVSPSWLSRRFNATVGVTLSTYLKLCRLEFASLLLIATEVPLNTIAYRAGFGTRATFFRAFKRATGVTPRTYRKTHTGR